MKKLLFKLFMPKPDQLAKIAATAAADFVNSTGKEALISNIAQKADSITKARELVLKWLADGKIDQAEVLELQTKLEPLAEALYQKILEKIGG